MTDLKTGILLWSQGASWPEQLEAAQRVDRLGYDHLWTWDHLYAIFGDPYQPIFEGWTSLAAWAMATERTRLGLQSALAIDATELDSVMRLIHSRLDASVRAHLEDGAEEPPA